MLELEAVSAMTDVAGFGLGGHLLEMCEGSNLMAEIYYDPMYDYQISAKQARIKFSGNTGEVTEYINNTT